MKDNIILTGFMGCGKTSVGIRLSYTLRRTLIDTDKWIEKKQGKTVSEILPVRERRRSGAWRANASVS